MIIFLYIVFSIYTYATREHIRYYEVSEGSIVKSLGYTGLAIREESVEPAVSNGYVHYFIQEGRRVPVGGKVYTQDETGALQNFLDQHPELSNELSDVQLRDIQNRLTQLTKDFDNQKFSELYNARNDLNTAVMEYSGLSATHELDAALQQAGISYVVQTAPKAGLVSYITDGGENLNAEQVTESMFTPGQYKKKIVQPGSLVEKDSPVYRLITNTAWQLIFPVTEEERLAYQDQSSIRIEFPDTGIVTDAGLALFTGADGKVYARLELGKYMENYEQERLIRFDLVQRKLSGLKIPASAIVSKNFYIVPKELKASDERGDEGFYRQEGSAPVFVPTDIYKEDDSFCYIEAGEGERALKPGDTLVDASGSGAYQLAKTAAVEGVYNINKGYAVFRQIERLDQNSEYILVKAGTRYGISVYDHIVLNAATVTEGKLIYE